MPTICCMKLATIHPPSDIFPDFMVNFDTASSRPNDARTNPPATAGSAHKARYGRMVAAGAADPTVTFAPHRGHLMRRPSEPTGAFTRAPHEHVMTGM